MLLCYPFWGQVQVMVIYLPSLPEKTKVPLVQSLAGMEIVIGICWPAEIVPLAGLKDTPGKLLEADEVQFN